MNIRKRRNFPVQGLIQKIRAVSDIGQKGHFFEKWGPNFHHLQFNTFSKCCASNKNFA